LDLELPNQWLWDVIDEFIYQAQEFSQYSTKLRGKTEEELNHLKSNNGVRTDPASFCAFRFAHLFFCLVMEHPCRYQVFECLR
jgi:hypothetical protein